MCPGTSDNTDVNFEAERASACAELRADPSDSVRPVIAKKNVPHSHEGLQGTHPPFSQ